MAELANQKVSIDIGPKMFRRFEDLPNTVSHVLAEFVDNALQSSRDHREELRAIDPNYKLNVNIEIFWDENESKVSQRLAKKFIITDNAAGIDLNHYAHAFKSAETPDDDSGLNEFGMGLKTAACWLGETWSVKTKALGENVERLFRFDINEVTDNELKELPYETRPKAPGEHGTIIEIDATTKNIPTFKSLGKIRTEIASIYRNSLREDELDILVNDNPLEFVDYQVLHAPFYNKTDDPAKTWRYKVDFKFGKYKATGFIAILRDINSLQNGLVLSRRGRVIIGAESDGRYFPKILFGAPGNFKYKRLFGELELEGFAVSFNKNDIQDKDNLEMLMEALRDKIREDDPQFFPQADGYRADNTAKQVRKLVTKHDDAPKAKHTPVVIDTKAVEEKIRVESDSVFVHQPYVEEPAVINEYKKLDVYDIGSKQYHLQVKFVEGGSDLIYVGTPKELSDTIVCNINVKHVFFKHFGDPSDSIVAILKSLVIAKFTAGKNGNGSAAELMEYFNEFIKKTQV